MYFKETAAWQDLIGTDFPVKNGHLIARFHALKQALREEEDIDFVVEKVKAHSGYEGNEHADKLANDARSERAPAWIDGDDLQTKPSFRGILPLTNIDDATLGKAITATKYGKARGPDNVDGWVIKKAWSLLHPSKRSFKLKKKPETPEARLAWIQRYLATYPDATEGIDLDSASTRMAETWNAEGGHAKMLRLVRKYGQPPDPPEEELPEPQRQARTAAVSLIEALRRLLQHAFTTGEVPRAWGRTAIVAIAKKTKVMSGADTRGISLMSHTAKIAARIISRRLNAIPVGQWQSGFRNSKSTMHAAAVLRELFLQYRRRGKELHCVFIDAKKAFDLTSRSAIDAALYKAGVSNTERRLIQNMLQAEMNVIGADDGLPRLSTSTGVRQGCPASPVYFILALDAAVRAAGLAPFVPAGHQDFGDLGFAILGYADDIVLIHDDPVILQQNVTRCLTAMREIGLECNVDKTKSMSLKVRQPYHQSRQAREKYEAERSAGDVIEPVAHVIAQVTKPDNARKTQAIGKQVSLVYAVGKGEKARSFKCPCCDAHRKTSSSLNRHMRWIHGYASETILVTRCDECNRWHHANLARHSAAICKDKGQKTKTCDTCRMCFSTDAKQHFCIGRKLDDAYAAPEVIPDLMLRRGDGGLDEPRRHAEIVHRKFRPLGDAADPKTGEPLCFEQVASFQYLGTTVTDEWEGRDCADLRKKVAKGKHKAFLCARFLRTTDLPRRSRNLLMQQHVMAATMYGCELWAPTHERDLKKLYSLQCLCLRWIENLRPTVTRKCVCGKKERRKGCKCPDVWTYPHNVDVVKRAKQEDIRTQLQRRQWRFSRDVLENRTLALPERRIAERPSEKIGTRSCAVGRTLYEEYRAMAKPPQKSSLRTARRADEEKQKQKQQQKEGE